MNFRWERNIMMWTIDFYQSFLYVLPCPELSNNYLTIMQTSRQATIIFYCMGSLEPILIQIKTLSDFNRKKIQSVYSVRTLKRILISHTLVLSNSRLDRDWKVTKLLYCETSFWDASCFYLNTRMIQMTL